MENPDFLIIGPVGTGKSHILTFERMKALFEQGNSHSPEKQSFTKVT